MILKPAVVFVCLVFPGLSPLSATALSFVPLLQFQDHTTISLLLPFTEGSVSTVNPSELNESNLVLVSASLLLLLGISFFFLVPFTIFNIFYLLHFVSLFILYVFHLIHFMLPSIIFSIPH